MYGRWPFLTKVIDSDRILLINSPCLLEELILYLAIRLSCSINLTVKWFLKGNSWLGTPQTPLRILPDIFRIIQLQKKLSHLGWQLQQVHNLSNPCPGKAFFLGNIIQKTDLSIIQHFPPQDRLMNYMLFRQVNHSFLDNRFFLDYPCVTYWNYCMCGS